MRKFRTLKSKKTPLKPKPKWLMFFGFVVLIMGVFYFVFRFVSAYRILRLSQVYLFVHSATDEVLHLDAILIKSAVMGQPHEVIYVPPSIAPIPYSRDVEMLKITVANTLKLPVDKIVFTPQKPTHRLALAYQGAVGQFSCHNMFDCLAEKIDLIIHVLVAETTDRASLHDNDLPNMFLERSLIQNSQACSIAVINTTEVNGLASRMSDLLEKNGAYIVRVVSNDLDLDKSYVLVDDSKNNCLVVAKKLEGLLPQHGELQRGEVIQPYRADIVIFLGNNLAQFAF